MTKRRGFTLIEYVVSLALAVIVIGYAIIATARLIQNRELEITVSTLVSYLRTAETRAAQSEGNASHGVSTAGGQMTLFRGSSYASRVTGYDIVRPYEDYVVFSGLSEIVFAKQTGTPSVTGTITLSNGLRSSVITIYSTGAISSE